MAVSATAPASAWMSSSTSSSTATAVGWLALLQEPDVTLRAHALHQLLGCVDTLWHEVAEALPDLEAFAEDLDLPLELRQTAAAIASRVFFHLQEPSQALRLALEAGEQHFDVGQIKSSPYVERLVAAGLDAYIAHRAKIMEEEPEDPDQKKLQEDVGLPMDRLQGMVHRLLEASCANGNYDHALGIALEARETDQIKNILVASDYSPQLLQYSTKTLKEIVTNKLFRQQALEVVVKCWEQQLLQQKDQEYKGAAVDLVLVHQLLGQPAPVAQVLQSLFQGTEQDFLLGLQLCFDLVDNGDQAFVTRVAQTLQPPAATTNETAFSTRLEQARRVLVGGFSSELALSFLHKQSNADRLIMDNLKKMLEERASGSRSSVLHNSAVMTHSFLYAGTTNDSFLRDHLDWMKKASNW
jgi:26S proteasome regulatory subunit N2